MSGLRQLGALAAWGVALVLPACASTSPLAAGSSTSPMATRSSSTGPCRAEAAQAAVGQAGSPQLAEWARQQSGALKVRVIGHDDMVTKEYDSSRLNLQLDPAGKVVRVYCG